MILTVTLDDDFSQGVVVASDSIAREAFKVLPVNIRHNAMASRSRMRIILEEKMPQVPFVGAILGIQSAPFSYVPIAYQALRHVYTTIAQTTVQFTSKKSLICEELPTCLLRKNVRIVF
jgi:hypothetical protein